MEDGCLATGEELIRKIKEKYHRTKLKHDKIKRKYDAIQLAYDDVKKELDIVKEELQKHVQGFNKSAKRILAIKIECQDDEPCANVIKVDEKSLKHENDGPYSSDDFIITVNENHLVEDCEENEQVFKQDLHVTPRKTWTSKVDKSGSDSSKNSFHNNDGSIIHNVDLTPIQCYYNDGKKGIKSIKNNFLSAEHWTKGIFQPQTADFHPTGALNDVNFELAAVKNEPVSNECYTAKSLIGTKSFKNKTPNSVTSKQKQPRIRRCDKSYRCEICGNIYAGTYNYNRHKLIHTGEKPFKCYLCDKSFARKDKFTLHLRKHEERGMYNIEYSVDGSGTDQNLEGTHGGIKLEADESGFSLYRDVDGIEAYNLLKQAGLDPNDMRNGQTKPGVKNGKRKDNTKIECNICSKIIRGAENMAKHQRKHAAKKPKECNVCGKVFLKTYSFNRHKKVHSGEKPFICSLCGQGFSRNDKLLAHIRKHKWRPPGEECHKCDICGLFFAQLSHVTQHKQVHAKDMRLFCDICGQSFYLQAHLDAHKETEHIFKKKRHFKARAPHSKSSFKRRMGPSFKKLFKCIECGKAFSLRYQLTRHKRIHTNHKPHKCRQCGKEFIEKLVLIKHKRMHSKECL
ncbi:unnamed protein product [Lymnaea stagnalis]|uniref:C2H2-type domain-containing protein n=1 Tax=Lymnaea stagnalis TaxID=6523 RepID=A0AAV2HWT5_LYMST